MSGLDVRKLEVSLVSGSSRSGRRDPTVRTVVRQKSSAPRRGSRSSGGPAADSDPTRSAGTVDATIRVGIVMVHNHELLASAVGVALGLEPRMQVVAVEASPTTGPHRALAAGVDVVLVDSLSLISVLRDGAPGPRVVVLGADNDPGVILACVRAGAVACVGEDTSPTVLAGVIRRVHAGEAVYDPRVLMELLQRPNSLLAAPPRRTARLSDRELDVLKAIARGSSSVEAARDLSIKVSTFRSHVKNILGKLEARSKLEAVIIAIREGRIELPQELG
jgi:DNA-binding NarL/FixJ family response regulator